MMGPGLQKIRHELRLMRPYAPQLIAVAAAIAIGMGFWVRYRGLRDSKRLEMTCAEYTVARPANHWVKLTGCEYDFDHAAYKKENGSIEQVYIPVRPAGDTLSAPQIVVRRDDRLTRDVVEQLQENRTPSQAMAARFRAELARPIEGMVTSSLDFDGEGKADIENLKLGLAYDYVMIDVDAEPHPIIGIAVLVVGVLAGAFAGVLFVRDRRYRKNHPPPPAPPRPPTPRPRDPNNPIRAFERPV